MDRLDIAIQRIKQASEMSEYYYNAPIIVTYSGGKDSDVLLKLTEISGVKFEVLHSHTTADAPQTVYHIREKFKDLEARGINCKIEYPTYKGKRTTMWDLIIQKKIPPTRVIRYCCSILKETGGKNRAIMTGVRWAESRNRKKRGIYEDINSNKEKKIVLNNDNDDKRKIFERCELQAKTVTNSIIDWSDSEVWDFLNYTKVKTNPLYDCGMKRVGCIGCPLAGKKRYTEFEMFPQYKKLYLSAFKRMLELRKAEGKNDSWENETDVFRWWLEEDWRQMSLFEYD